MTTTIYQMQQGETLKSVARDKLGNENRWTELAYINSLTPPYFVAPGTIIQLPTDDHPIELLVTGGNRPPQNGTPAAGKADTLSPASTVALAAGALFVLWILGAR